MRIYSVQADETSRTNRLRYFREKSIIQHHLMASVIVPCRLQFNIYCGPVNKDNISFNARDSLTAKKRYYFGSVWRNSALAKRPMKLTESLSVGGNAGIGTITV